MDQSSTLTPDGLLERNERYAATHSPRGIAPDAPVIIVTCIDGRTDPAHVLGVDVGSCLVFRNSGGRITTEAENELALMVTMMKATGGPAPTIVVMHHTDCGLSRLTDPQVRAMLVGALGVVESDLEARAIGDPAVTVRHDVARLNANPVIAGSETLALVFDVTTGVATRVDS